MAGLDTDPALAQIILYHTHKKGPQNTMANSSSLPIKFDLELQRGLHTAEAKCFLAPLDQAVS